MKELGHGRFESMRIHQGQLILYRWPTTSLQRQIWQADSQSAAFRVCRFDLKDRLAEFFAYVRRIDGGVIRVLEVRGGLPIVWMLWTSPIQSAFDAK
jgi:hypothetical protein